MNAFQLSEKSWVVRLYVWMLSIWDSFWHGDTRRLVPDVDLCTMLPTIGAITVLIAACVGIVGWAGLHLVSSFIEAAKQPGFFSAVFTIITSVVLLVLAIVGITLACIFISWLIKRASVVIGRATPHSNEKWNSNLPEQEPSTLKLLYLAAKNQLCPRVRLPMRETYRISYFPRLRYWVIGTAVLLALWGFTAIVDAFRAFQTVTWSATCSPDAAKAISKEVLGITMDCGVRGKHVFKTSSMKDVVHAVYNREKSDFACTMNEADSFNCSVQKN